MMRRLLFGVVSLLLAASQAVAQTYPGKTTLDQPLSIRAFGAVGDGSSHRLSSYFSTLAAAQAVYPFVNDLSQEIDWAATQQAINTGYANNGQSAYCPPVSSGSGAYQLSNPIQLLNSPYTNSYAIANYGYSNWSASTTYTNGQGGIIYNGLVWSSNGNGNIGNPPTSVNSYPAAIAIQSGANNGLPYAQVSVSSASPAVVTLNGFNLAVGTPIIFLAQTYSNPTYTSPALPAGISANQVYYIISAGLTANTFEFSATPGGAAINTTSTGSGVITMTTQVWSVVPQGSPDFGNRATFTGDTGQPASGNAQGCRFFYNGFTSTAFVVGGYDGNKVSNIRVDGPGNNGNPYRCQMPTGSVGVGIIASGGGAHITTLDHVDSIGFNTAWQSYVGGNGQLGDSNTLRNGHYSSSCTGLKVTSGQNYINSAFDVTIDGDSTAIDNHITQFHVFGGNHSASGGASSSFAITGVSVANVSNNYQITATVTSPDGYLNHPMCGYNRQCVYTVWTIKSTHYGIVPLALDGFNPATKVINFHINQDWIGQFNNTCCGSDFSTELGATTKLYAVEMTTAYQGGIMVEGSHVENAGAATTLLSAWTSFNSGSAKLEHVLIDYDPSLADYVCCLSNPSDGQLAEFYAQQSVPFIYSGNVDVTVEVLPGGNIKTWDRVLYEGGATANYAEFRHTNSAQPASGGYGINPEGPGNLFNHRFDSSNTFDGSYQGIGNCCNYNWQYGNAATGGGLWDTGGPWVSGSWSFPDYWRSAGWGVSKFIGARPAFDASPCITPSQYATLSGTLPAITYVSTLLYIQLNAGGTLYQNGDVLTLVGGTGTAGQVTVDNTSSGAITQWHVSSGGQYTAEASSFTSTGGHGTGATWTIPPLPTSAWYVNYSIGYPILWGGTIYHICDWKGTTQTKYAVQQNGTGYSYFQNLTTTNVPNLSWSGYSVSPIIYMNPEALELMFPGLVITLTGSSSSPCNNATPQVLIITEVNPTLGYVRVLNAGQNGSPYLPQWGSGNTCTGTTIGQAAPSLVNPY